MLAFLLYRLLCGLLRLLVRAGVDDRELEIAILRHQLRVLTRRGKRARYSTADRAFLAAATRFLPQERWSAFPLVPETLKRWRRQLETKKGSRGRRGPGRPPIDPEARDLTLRMARENPRWGYLRIKGELLKLGISMSATTIANVLRRGDLGPAPPRIGPTWGEFLRAQALTFLPTRLFVSDHQIGLGTGRPRRLRRRRHQADLRSSKGAAWMRLLPLIPSLIIRSPVGKGPPSSGPMGPSGPRLPVDHHRAAGTLVTDRPRSPSSRRLA